MEVKAIEFHRIHQLSHVGFVLKHKWLYYCGDLETVDPPHILTMRAFPANTAHSPNVGLMLANVVDVSLTLKQHWVNVSWE